MFLAFGFTNLCNPDENTALFHSKQPLILIEYKVLKKFFMLYNLRKIPYDLGLMILLTWADIVFPRHF